MRFTALTLLALGASAAAYVVNDKKVVTDNAVEARVVVSGVRALHGSTLTNPRVAVLSVHLLL